MVSNIERKLESSVRKALHEYNLIETPKIALALSGGKDSLTMLHLLKAISGRGFPELDLHAIHVSGEFSCGPAITEKFLGKTCEDLGVPFTSVHAEQKRELLECYSCSRTRRKLLFDKAKELGYQHIAFGHHQDDSIQTLLMNLLQKGEFVANLPKVPMIHFGITIIRPLILLYENDIIAFAKEKGFARIVCQCPVGQNSQRKKTKELIDEMEKLFPHARNNLGIASREQGLDKALKP